MTVFGERWELHCPACNAVEFCGIAQALTRLRELGFFRRSAEPESQAIAQLLAESAPRLPCQQCRHTGLDVRSAADDEWDDERTCERCGKTIPAERLELFPDATLCTACQVREDAGETEDVDYCPRCGNVMHLRAQSGRGPTRYVLTCSQCGR
jgi:predicted RNA-binding Zn-ribbon protein involved in translation (DUF1610 family)